MSETFEGYFAWLAACQSTEELTNGKQAWVDWARAQFSRIDIRAVAMSHAFRYRWKQIAFAEQELTP